MPSDGRVVHHRAAIVLCSCVAMLLLMASCEPLGVLSFEGAVDDDTGDDDTGDDDTGDDDTGDDDTGDDDTGDDDTGDDDTGDDDTGDDDTGDDDTGDDDTGDDDTGDDDTGDDDTSASPCDDDDSAAGPGGTTSPCSSVCGNGILECSEQCDSGSSNSNVIPGACRTTCLLVAACGDGLVDPGLGELCDDGNSSGCDGCDASCLPEAGTACGNGSIDLGEAEICDDGNSTDGDGCSALCRPDVVGAACGDGQTIGAEICDDGNLVGGDNCNPTCNLENRSTVLVGMAGQPGNIDAAASSARLGGPGALLALNEYIYYGDSANHTVRRIHIPTAAVSTIAGDGSPGYADLPQGTSSRFGSIDGLASDGETLWVSDRANGRLRAIDLAPCSSTHCFSVSTVAGSGLNQHQDSYGASAGFDQIGGIAWLGGLIYVADEGSSTLRTVDPTTAEVQTIAGIPYTTGILDGYSGTALLSAPRSVSLGTDGTLFISDPGSNTIRRWNPVLGYMDTFAGTGGECHTDGSVASAQIPSASGMTHDGTSLYWAESEHNTVRQALLSDGETSTMLGSPCTMCGAPTCGACAGCAGSHALGIGQSARLNSPVDVAFHFQSNSLFVLDGGNYIILRIR